MTLLNKNDPKLVRKALNWLFRYKIGYLTGDINRFVIDDDQVRFQQSSQPTGVFSVVIVARRNYQEFVKTYPLASLSELKAVLAQEYADKALVKHVISAAEGNQRRVCTYVFTKEAIESLQSAWMVLPESLLLWLGERSASVLYIKSEQPFFLATGTDLPLSQRLNPVLQNAEMFKISQGLPGDLATSEIDANELPVALFSAFKRSLFNQALHRFWQLPRLDISPFQLKLAAAGSAVAAILYLAATSIFLQISVSQHQKAIASLGSDVNVLLEQQSRFETQVNDFNQYVSIKNQKQFTAHLWLLVSELNKQEPSLELNSINSDEDFLVLRGKSGRATALLASVQSNPLVAKAEFSAPVLREGDKESFVIRLQLIQQSKKQGVAPDAK
jgi:hypothetical protein